MKRMFKGFALALVATVALSVGSAEAAYDSGHKARVDLVKTGGTLRVDIRARGGIQLYVVTVRCAGYEPAIWAHHGTTRQRFAQSLPRGTRCYITAKARAHRGQVRVRVT